MPERQAGLITFLERLFTPIELPRAWSGLRHRVPRVPGARSIGQRLSVIEWWLAVAAATTREKRAIDIESLSHAK